MRDDTIDEQRLVDLLVRPGSSTRAEIEQRLRGYVAAEHVHPSPHLTSLPLLIGKIRVHDRRSAPDQRVHDAWFEARRCEGLPPLQPKRPSLTQLTPASSALRFSRDDVKLIAELERKLAPLPWAFNQWLWGVDEDPHALPLAGSANAVRAAGEVPVKRKVLLVRLGGRGVLYGPTGKVVGEEQLARWLQDEGLIEFARTNDPKRGGTGLWDYERVVDWLVRLKGCKWGCNTQTQPLDSLPGVMQGWPRSPTG